MLEFLGGSSFKRIVAAVVMVVLPLLNAKLGLDIPSEQVVAAILGIAGYIVQSGMKSAAVAKADSNTEAAAILANGNLIAAKMAQPVANPDPTPSIRPPL